jgi:scyllo-inositol 2-dehydrogenase (NADP+)
VSADQPITTVIAGLGRAGWDIHWRQLLRDHPRFAVIGVIEPLAERRAEAVAEIGCRAYATFEEYLADPVGELITIATPSGGHGPEALACLQRGLHVAVDKPMCQSVAEAEACMAVAREHNLMYTCYHPYRFNPMFMLMGEVIASGRLGRIVEIKCNRSAFNRRNDWVMRRAKGGGLHNVWGSHSVDQALQLAGAPPQDIFSDLQCTVTPGDADDHCKIVIRCTNGVLVDVEVSNCQAYPAKPEWMVAGTCGGMESTSEGVRVRWFDPAEAPRLEMVEGAARNRRYDNDDVLPWQEETLTPPAGRGSVTFYDNIAAHLCEGAPLLITPESVRETVYVLEESRRQNPSLWAGFE